jgi:hypothetical protein
VFNAWNQIKSGGTGGSTGFGLVNLNPLHVLNNSKTAAVTPGVLNINKRTRKINDKEKEKERIYITNSEEKALRHKGQNETQKIDFIQIAQKYSDSKTHVGKRS